MVDNIFRFGIFVACAVIVMHLSYHYDWPIYVRFSALYLTGYFTGTLVNLLERKNA